MTDSVFPLGYPGPTLLYLSLYVATLIVHMLFMNYVVAGAGFLAIRALRSRVSKEATDDPVAACIRDWLPFAISAAITAGVAPLLFVQILYKESFYTSNLLLSHRWMSIVPALILGFYLAYLLKSKRVTEWPRYMRAGVGLGAFACFLFTGFSWTENHLLQVDHAIWPSFFESRAWLYKHVAIIPRVGIWATFSMATLATLVGWQLHTNGKIGRVTPDSAGRLGILALWAIGLSGLSTGLYYAVIEPDARSVIRSSQAIPHAVMIGIGVVAQLIAWIGVLRLRVVTTVWLALASVGLTLTLAGACCVRETLRLAKMDLAPLLKQHEAAMASGGLIVFILFTVINGALIGWCISVGRTAGAKRQPSGDQASPSAG